MMDALIRVADRGNDGTLDFNDFAVSFTSFCALSTSYKNVYIHQNFLCIYFVIFVLFCMNNRSRRGVAVSVFSDRCR